MPVSLALEAGEGQVTLTARDKEGRVAAASAPAAEGIAPLSPERCVQQLSKTGGTPFRAGPVSVPPEGAPCGVSALNALRREALEKLLALRQKRQPIPFQRQELSFPSHPKRQGTLPLRAQFRTVEQVPAQAKACREIVLPLETPVEALRGLGEQGYPSVILDIPRALFGEEKWTAQKMEQLMEAGYTKFLCGNLGAVALARQLGAEVHGSFGLNIFNTASLEFFRTLGLSTAELSFELAAKEIAPLVDGLWPGAVDAHPELPLGQFPQRVPPLQGAGLPHRPETDPFPGGVPGREKYRSAQLPAPVAV